MTKTAERQLREEQLAGLLETLTEQLRNAILDNPPAAEAIANRISDVVEQIEDMDGTAPLPTDGGLSNLVGLGDEAAPEFGQTYFPGRVMDYDESVSPERLVAVAHLYYQYQMHKLGVFDVGERLIELFNAGTVRLSTGRGAFRLYRSDALETLRRSRTEREQLYRRVFGYTSAPPPREAQPNTRFHPLFVAFMTQVARYFRDKRITEVMRNRPNDPAFGSVAQVRRSGLDLRNNLKNASYGNVSAVTVETQQLLRELFEIFGSDDVLNIFGATNAWEVVEDVQRQHMGRIYVPASQRHRMAVTGMNVIRWLAHPHILTDTRIGFEAKLTAIADDAEEWLMSAQTLKNEQPYIVPARAKRVIRSERMYESGSGTLILP
jgi:hypothetical protein